MTLDGTREHGFSGKPLIVIDGSHAGVAVDGLALDGGASTVTDLAIDNFAGNGIVLGSSGGNLILGCFTGGKKGRPLSSRRGVAVPYDLPEQVVELTGT